MECIVQGFQYTAYGDQCLVYKVSLSVDQVCYKFRATWGGGSPARERVTHDREAGLAVVRETRAGLESRQLPRALIVDANIDEQLNYEQSRVNQRGHSQLVKRLSLDIPGIMPRFYLEKDVLSLHGLRGFRHVVSIHTI